MKNFTITYQGQVTKKKAGVYSVKNVTKKNKFTKDHLMRTQGSWQNQMTQQRGRISILPKCCR